MGVCALVYWFPWVSAGLSMTEVCGSIFPAWILQLCGSGLNEKFVVVFRCPLSSGFPCVLVGCVGGLFFRVFVMGFWPR